ncbi:Uncharacterised protein [Mycobacterium tuberculosis]|nr:Uncharacterised protein [Mycobacterium tuberculosis]CKQ84805.1 Uncharacterised protein [Mycobacterium tuberculosis]CKV16110.1 Uncharacterised protein [Mycobacterium tuberculosis]CMF61345.1 Uncharacterised protein [Mycobacterium tuberculosis]CMF96028.1 Uncharacterised protein [Mycobacterium tuberculosis]
MARLAHVDDLAVGAVAAGQVVAAFAAACQPGQQVAAHAFAAGGAAGGVQHGLGGPERRLVHQRRPLGLADNRVAVHRAVAGTLICA